MTYVDGFVLPISKDKVQAYRAIARKAGRIWMEHGALEYRECVGEDLDSQQDNSFTRKLRLKPGETVVFAWIVYKSRAHRDRVNKKVMSDPRLKGDVASMPFDHRRMHYGGFETIVELGVGS